MTVNFDNALGIHPQALALREKRGEILASNLANADTPGFKAKDIDFQSVLRHALPAEIPVETTQAGHLRPQNLILGGKVMYRNPMQPSLDGNTVETQIEQAKYAENSLQYQASLRFVNGKLQSLMTAIKGE
ncbi:MAG: flagellar basal body rod protein FlgB [Gammaproteobacteria bacterium]